MRSQSLKRFFRMELNPLRCAVADARVWESSPFPCPEAAGHVRQLGGRDPSMDAGPVRIGRRQALRFARRLPVNADAGASAGV